MVITRASHARGPEFDPRFETTFFFFFGWWWWWEDGGGPRKKKREKKPALFVFVCFFLGPLLPKVVVGILA